MLIKNRVPPILLSFTEGIGNMKIIVGLGNPGKKYEKTRHNAGFMVLDRVADSLSVSINSRKFKSLISETFVNGQKIVLVKPQTFMNLSGEAVREVFDFYNADVNDLIVVTDDKDLDIGGLRVRAKGSSGGQNGLKSIIQYLGTQEFARIKVGIGSNSFMSTADYVLGKMDEGTALDEAAKVVVDFINGASVLDLMNKYNSKGN